MTETTSDRYIYRSELRQRLAISDDTCRRWEASGKLTPFKLNGPGQQSWVCYLVSETEQLEKDARIVRRAKLNKGGR